MRAATGHFTGCGRLRIAQRAIGIVDTLRMTQQPDDHDSQPDKQHHFFDWTKNDVHDDGAPKLEGKPLIGEEKLRIIMLKQALEEQHLEVIKKARTIRLPFDVAVKWVRSMGVDLWGWQSKEDWIEWLQQGEGISQYIPTDPESYYGPGGRGGGKDGVWKGWDYWLGTGEYRNHLL